MRSGYDWCSATMAERLVQLYTSLTFGDPLIGCLVASLLVPGGSGAVQLAIIDALIEVSHSRVKSNPFVKLCILPSKDMGPCAR